MLSVWCVSRGKQSLVYIHPSFPEERWKKIFQKKIRRKSVSVHMCVCVYVCDFVFLFVLKKDRDGGAGPSLDAKLNNNKSAEPESFAPPAHNLKKTL